MRNPSVTDPTMTVSNFTTYNNCKAETRIASTLGPITSTPFPRKQAASMQGRKVNGECKAKVQVHDGSAFREITITSTESLLDVLDKVSKAIKRPSRTINLGYVAPWSMKIKSTKCPSYITTDDELHAFWLAYVGYQGHSARGKKQAAKAEMVSGITFQDIKDDEQVNGILI